ncbi:OsmC family peroxiredoxin [Nakamurella endophytica]|uniref:Osmotically inducible protein OsmC n=1 Tax=Nakamurella endophytica TaxID=1748367 RepID=A0A917SQ28_9ACTN|nr:OsmC family peroxiredoxin [Nakamurella endophytica]GGL89986.1 osmotically inducible protein OsmC [Nakamurella endophytica]
MPTRTARTAWNGTLEQGSGQVELTSSGVGTYFVSFPKRAADDADGTTSPEELIAAAHSSCYAMQLSALIGQAGGTPQSIEVRADVSLGPDRADSGFKLTGITLTVRAEVDGLDADAFQAAAQAAKAGCPVSKALAGVEITLDAQLES